MPDRTPSAPGRAAESADTAPTTVFLSAGEASGDWVGAMLAHALAQLRPGLRLCGIGGRRMAEAGMELIADSSAWGAIGLFEALAKLPTVAGILRAVRGYLRQHPPALLILIDCGAFNLPLARVARARGIRTLYYFPPGSWARDLRNGELRDLVDVIATPFSWSRDLLSGGRARVEWVGHPVVEAAQPRLSREEALRRYGLDPGKRVIALAPGSRDQELRYLFPVLAAAAALLAQQLHQVQFLVPVAPSLRPSQIQAVLDRRGVTALLLSGMDYDALQLAEAAVVCSGTATLEFACLEVPMAVAYRASRLTTLQYRLVRGLLGGQRFAAMPNIICGREVVPELLGARATPRALAEEVMALLGDAGRRERMRAELRRVRAALGEPGASRRTAELAVGLIADRESS